MALQGLQAYLLGHVGNHPRLPQAAVEGLPGGHRIYANAVKGLSVLQMSRDLGVAYKTAFVLAHKIRESLMMQRNDAPLPGKSMLTGAYVNGHIRPKNKKEKRIDRRLAIHQKPGKRCVSG